MRPDPVLRLQRGVLLGVSLVTVVLAAINLSPLMDSWTVDRLLQLDAEANIPVWISSTLLLAIAASAALASWVEHRSGGRGAVGWAAIAALFVALSADETSGIHEVAGNWVSRVVDIGVLDGLRAWVLLAPFAAAVAFAVVGWIGRTLGWGSPEARLVAGAVALWLAVPGLEVIAAVSDGSGVVAVLEESLELLGQGLFLSAVSGHALRGLYREGVVGASRG